MKIIVLNLFKKKICIYESLLYFCLTFKVDYDIFLKLDLGDDTLLYPACYGRSVLILLKSWKNNLSNFNYLCMKFIYMR